MHLNVEDKISHRLWRKFVKKERRRIRRTQCAQEHDEALAAELELFMSDPDYVDQLKEEEEYAEKCRSFHEDLSRERREEWRLKDLALHSLWLLNRKRQSKMEQEKKMREDNIRKEFEENAVKENEKHTLDAKEALLQQATSQLGNEVGVTRNPDPPPGYVRPDLRPKGEPCPFFLKTGACRFGINCSREHDYPETSHTILLPNMFTHFGMNAAAVDDYDTDTCLEYTESDSYMYFKEFFEDVLPEFQKLGKVVQFKVCKNKSSHLKGNVYVQFEKIKHAEAAIFLFNGRWYAGRQISCIFVPVERWKSAICGLYWSRRCPKGDHCNFLHVFRNPNNTFYEADLDRSVESQRSHRSDFDSSSRRHRYSRSPSSEHSNRNSESSSRKERRKSRRESSDREERRKSRRESSDREIQRRSSSRRESRSSSRRKSSRSPSSERISRLKSNSSHKKSSHRRSERNRSKSK